MTTHKLYGQQTELAVANFPISQRGIPAELIHALGLVKWAAARANQQLGLFTSAAHPLAEEQVDAIFAAAREVAEGKLDSHFPVDLFQTGSGTSSNMNVNEVIAARATEIADEVPEEGDARTTPFSHAIHPNDHINCGQSTNDIFPTAIHVAAAVAIQKKLVPEILAASRVLAEKAKAWRDVLKIGRTHLADATPLYLGQEVGGWGRQFELAAERAAASVWQLLELPVGGTAVGTGINTHPQFAARVCQLLAAETEIPFVEAENHFEANAQRDGIVACHAAIKSVAVTLFNVANNLRWLASGPRCGFFEISLAELQAGSSIMPGKVNPVLCESALQVAARVFGNDATICFSGASGGQFQLNIMMPVMADALLDSIRLLTSTFKIITEKCFALMEANAEVCAAAVEKSLALATALNPVIGYEAARKIAKEAFHSGKTVREICSEQAIMSPEKLAQILNPHRMTSPMQED